MISIIICSRKAQISSVLFQNIMDTIGCHYELIVIDNSENKYSIFEAYNAGIKKSSGNYLCFIHDDIKFHTANWGEIIESIFESEKKIGLIGIAGTKLKTKMPSSWWDTNYNVLKIKQHYKDGSTEILDKGFEISDIVEVVAIDGVFMAMRRNDKFIFDEQLKGFHNYDLYLSLQNYKQQKKICVTNRIFLEHFSEGNLNTLWIESTSSFHKKYKNDFPIYLEEQFSKEHIKKLEYKIGVKFIATLIEQKMYKDAIYWWYKIFKIHPFSKYHYKFWKDMLKKISC